MLYKKYHRNFISQFKKGAKLRKDSDIQIVTTRPFPRLNLVTGRPYITVDTTIDEHGGWIRWTLVSQDGKINYKIKIEEDVIQEISQELY